MIEKALPIALKIAKPFEGLSLTPYHDPAGYPTIGYGHLLSKEKWADLSQWAPISEHDAEIMLASDMASALKMALQASPVLANSPKRFAAIGDFVYNLGIGQYRASTLKRKIDGKDWHGAKQQIIRWNKAGGVVLRGLVLRRAAEATML